MFKIALSVILFTALTARCYGATCSGVWPLLKRGDSNREVTVAQYLLRNAGRSISLNGAFDAITETAVKSFQAANGLDQDGRIGPNTWRALIVTVRQGSRGDAVRAVQYKLRISADGIFGSGAQTAVVNFQRSKGLSTDGVVGRNTWAALLGCASGGSATGSRAQLARQILDSSRIELGRSSSTPGGNPYQNIVDTANGKKAASGCWDFSKCSSSVYLSTKLLQAMLEMAEGSSYHVTSLTGGRHGRNSDHCQGRGIDIRIWNDQSLTAPNNGHRLALNSCIRTGSFPSQTLNAYNEPRFHSNHVHCAYY